MVVPEEGKIVHISQAALGDLKGKVKGLIPLRVKIEEKEFILGSLSAEIIPHVTFDLVFEKEFELSHDCKNGSVYFCGYLEEIMTEEHDDFPYDSEDESLDSEDELPVNNDVTNGKLRSSKPVKKTSDDSSDDDIDESDEDDDSEDEETPKKVTASKILPVPSKKAKAKGGDDDNCGCGHAHTAATKRSKPAGKTNNPAKKAKHGGK
ncbi:histone deacetylase HDT1-like [Impatiens glandulifera]|uniref:histone deacetylase HDT1-like n=1 Tax=Impatiens glandulifera TaxID=253017 RepID=UPI001FB06426|nr:histone deacetylase HDT1-like [Impatiens glandulifera]